jgi:hypothetical protein
MSKPIIKGNKVPLSEKQEASPGMGFNPFEFLGSDLDIPAPVKAEMDSKGFKARWINFKQFKENGNQHRRKWLPFKPSPEVASQVSTDVEGYVRKGDLLLAFKTKEEHTKHKLSLKYFSDLYSGKENKIAEELRQLSGQRGLKVRVHEGYEANEGEDDE